MSQYTLFEIAQMTGLHKNTIRNYVKSGQLKGKLEDNGAGKDTWLVDEKDLYNCGIPQIIGRLGPQDVEQRLQEKEVPQTQDFRVYAEEIMRLNRDLVSAKEELGMLRGQLPALQAAQAERDEMRQEIRELWTVKDTLAGEKMALVGERDKFAGENNNLKEGLSKTEDDLNNLRVELMEAQANTRWSYRRRTQLKVVKTDTV